MAMTNEMQKLKKEPLQSQNTCTLKVYHKENVILGDYHDLLNNLKNSEDFLKCTTNDKPTLEELKNVLLNNQFGSPAQQTGRERVAINHLTAEICDDNNKQLNEPKRTNLDSMGTTTGGAVSVRNSSTGGGGGEDGEKVDRLTKELAEMKKTFEEERKKWTEEKEKVLVYQRQLQRNYLQMCKRNESLEEKMQRNVFRETGEPAISI